ncbi:MAG TPA: cupin domain-containing protein [Acidimicrobiales bacterium]|nr:cupin domain-containing protein [Acidimicrobiales bacterium]
MSPEPLALAALVEGATGSGVVWALPRGGGVNVNLVRLDSGEAIGEHVNHVVDVVLLGVAGTATVSVDGREVALGPGDLLVVPAGARRAIAARESTVGYLSLHRERGGLMPRGS